MGSAQYDIDGRRVTHEELLSPAASPPEMSPHHSHPSGFSPALDLPAVAHATGVNQQQARLRSGRLQGGMMAPGAGVPPYGTGYYERPDSHVTSAYALSARNSFMRLPSEAPFAPSPARSMSK